MAFNSVGHYTPNHKTWDHLGNILPNVEYSEGTRPHGEFKPAEWLPVQWFDKYFETWMVVMPGKCVSCDNNGDLVPSQYSDSSVQIVYTQDDVDAGVIDVRTGTAVTAAASFNAGTVSGFLGGTEVLSVSKPLGVAPYAYHQWAGGDGSNPTGLRQHNHRLQHQVAILCDYVLELPLVPAVTASEAKAPGDFSTSSNVHTASALANLPVAKNTVRTPITFAGTDGDELINEVSDVSLVTEEGDWHINLTTGVLTVYRAAGAPDITVTYYNYASAPASVSVFASAVGDLKCGDFVVCDENSNYKAATSEDFKDIVGQVLEIVDFPRSSLEKVKTAFQPAINTDASGSLPGYAGQTDQLPGSATGGVNSAIHMAGAANRMVHINLISR